MVPLSFRRPQTQHKIKLSLNLNQGIGFLKLCLLQKLGFLTHQDYIANYGLSKDNNIYGVTISLSHNPKQLHELKLLINGD